jgi:Holliday junction DNA helicase RuvA
MLTRLVGTVVLLGEGSVVLDVGGVGFEINCSSRTLANLRMGLTQVVLWTRLLVKEDSLTLFGFEEVQEQLCFDTLCKVSGVSGRIALRILGILTPAALVEALANGDEKVFSSVPGVGPKLATRLVLELHQSTLVKNFPRGAKISRNTNGGQLAEEALLALEGLGYSRGTVVALVNGLVTGQPQLSLESVITEALRKLNRF